MSPSGPRRIPLSPFTPTVGVFLAGAAAMSVAFPAFALDKQSGAHGGRIADASTGFSASGLVAIGVAPFNPTYAARPDNTGRVLMRYVGHTDLDIIGKRLSIPLDVNVFSDRDADGIGKARPSEIDLIGGVTSTVPLGSGAVELGARFEHDRAVGGRKAEQSYVDVRGRYVWALSATHPALATALADGDVTGWVTLGWFAYNPSYFARPDNTGNALFRYALHAEIALWKRRIALALDQTYFTDRQSGPFWRPTELDLTPELILRLDRADLHLAYERDMPLDRDDGLVQHFVYVLVGWSFGS